MTVFSVAGHFQGHELLLFLWFCQICKLKVCDNTVQDGPMLLILKNKIHENDYWVDLQKFNPSKVSKYIMFLKVMLLIFREDGCD